MNFLTLIENSVTKYVYHSRGWKLLAEKDEILVFENEDKVVMKYGFATIYSILDKRSIYTHSYFDYFIPLAYLYESPKVLMIGMGGGTILLQLNKLLGDKVHVDTVDVNKDIVEFAQKYFLNGTKTDIYIADGAQYVSGKKNAYDIIILDAFKGPRVPEQFFDEKFIEDANAALGEDGILAINIDVYDTHLDKYIAKLGKLFKVYKFRTSLHDSNVIIICSKKFDREYISNAVKADMPQTDENKFIFMKYGDLQ